MTFLSSPPKSIGERITWARKRKGLSQEALADKAGTTRRHVMRMERNKHAPRVALRERLAEVLDQKPSFFADDDEDEESDQLPSLETFLQRKVELAVNDAIERAVAKALGS